MITDGLILSLLGIGFIVGVLAGVTAVAIGRAAKEDGVPPDDVTLHVRAAYRRGMIEGELRERERCEAER